MASLQRGTMLVRPRATASRYAQHIPPRTHSTSSRQRLGAFRTTFRASFHHSSRRWQEQEGFGSRLRNALRDTKVQWYPIPVGLGIGLLGFIQFYKAQSREKRRLEEEAAAEPGAALPKRRPRIRPDGPWQVQIMSTLPLKAVSRLWGWFNERDIPYYLRIPGFKLYSYLFGVNLDEVAEPDLHVFPNLAAFFYRELKPGVRPLDPHPNALLSPADGKVLQYGQIQGNDIEQVKGMTYTIDALLGKNTRADSSPAITGAPVTREVHGDEELVKQDEQFALVNGISYSVPSLLSGPPEGPPKSKIEDQTVKPSSASAVSEVQADLALGERPWYAPAGAGKKPTTLYYCVVYLSPGDYHRFHSPANWVVERRRHFAGELYSVSPYLQRTLPGLFTLNERVVLLGRWRWGFFAYVPVGATNVGSIRVNFDRELRTNSLLTDTAADRAAEQAQARGEPYSGFAEATYAGASRVLGGYALQRGQEMGGFQLGSTIVLVFEAPTAAAEGSSAVATAAAPGEGKRGFVWTVEKGKKIKMGEALGFVEE